MRETLISWAKSALVRAVKTGAEVAVGYIGAATFLSEIDWLLMISATLLSMIVSVLVSVEGLPEVSGGASVLQILKTNAASTARSTETETETETSGNER